ncbi:hypothetical protein [Aneurinibacillus aneurinilyticus]|jgi:hypothetical protein|uniref:hypothetical protein n=1 Tax=Aneurinibacillus aneurinilyticus TaxID=1391 RepID=UPI0023F464BC|nr:hypothetical protein [Aneurinibacillus aneurinilyticus]
MLGHAKTLYEMYRLGKSVVNSKVFEKSLNKAKKNYQQKRKKQEKKLKRTKSGRRQLKEMKARQKATKQLWDGVTKMVQPLGKVLTSARKLANNLTKGELVKSVKKDMKKKVIQKQNCTLPVYVQADKRTVASVSLQESVDAFTIFLRKYPTAKEAKAALPTMSKYKGTYVYNQVEKAIRNGRYKSLVHFEEFMRVNGGHDPLFPRRGSGLTKNQTSNQLNINSSGNKSNSSSQGTSKVPSQFADRAKLEGHYEKHGNEFGGTYKNADEYLKGAQNVIKNGIKVQYDYKGETRTGYVKFMGNNRDGKAKFEFVGTNNNGEITTYHTQSGKKFWKTINGKNIPVINPVE